MGAALDRLPRRAPVLLVGIARGQGIARFEAEVLAGNAAMLSVFESSGLPMTKTQEDGVVSVELDLALTAPAGT